MKLFRSVLVGLCFLSIAIANESSEPSSMNIKFAKDFPLSTSGIPALSGNDVWGWTDPDSGREYAIMGLNSKTSFVDITDLNNPKHVVDIKTRTSNSSWRDIKVYKDHAYIVSEAYRHGMQIFDLKRLRMYLDRSKPTTLQADYEYTKFGNAHNIAINEDSGFAYAVGTSTCDGGLHIMDIRNPAQPKFVNCVGRGVYELPRKHGDAYTHDVQCVNYHGPDSRYIGREICISSNEDTVNVVDVTDKSKPYQISVSTYNAVKYTHQGWLSEDHRYFYLGDELDEQSYGVNTKTFIWDFADLQNIKQFAVHHHGTKAIDHNMYVKGRYIYQANYTAGLRILDSSDVANGKLEEVAYYDFMPNDDRAAFRGAWSVFPYFDSGTVVISGTNGVLYITRPDLAD